MICTVMICTWWFLDDNEFEILTWDNFQLLGYTIWMFEF